MKWYLQALFTHYIQEVHFRKYKHTYIQKQVHIQIYQHIMNFLSERHSFNGYAGASSQKERQKHVTCTLSRHKSRFSRFSDLLQPQVDCVQGFLTRQTDEHGQKIKLDYGRFLFSEFTYKIPRYNESTERTDHRSEE